MSARSATHLLISCPDRPGIVAGVSRFLFEQGANIVEADQYATEPEGGTFYMRMAFRLEGRRRATVRAGLRGGRRRAASAWSGGLPIRTSRARRRVGLA